MKEFKNITVNKIDKTFTILSGDVGSYPYRDIMDCIILYEDARFKGKSAPFTHYVKGNSITSSLFFHGNVWCGIAIALKDGRVLYAYISEEESQYNSLQFHADTKEAQKFIDFVNHHKVNFRNIRFNTENKTFSIDKGDVGTYSYLDIKKCKIIEENIDYYNDLHKIADYSINKEKGKVRFKVLFRMKDEQIVTAIISNDYVDIHSMYYYVDLRMSEQIVRLTKRIIKKYTASK